VSGNAVVTTTVRKHDNGNHYGQQLSELFGLSASCPSRERHRCSLKVIRGDLLNAGTWFPADHLWSWTQLRLTLRPEPPEHRSGGAYIDEDGTLSDLVVLVDGTGNDDTDGVVEVWINRSGVPRFQTPLTCTIGLNTTKTPCKDKLDQVPVLSGDRVFARWFGLGSSTDPYHDLQVTFTKQ
jgi:hypothetical protein